MRIKLWRTDDREPLPLVAKELPVISSGSAALRGDGALGVDGIDPYET
jgi:hypothetical protein